jgi:hypothetical protein
MHHLKRASCGGERKLREEKTNTCSRRLGLSELPVVFMCMSIKCKGPPGGIGWGLSTGFYPYRH